MDEPQPARGVRFFSRLRTRMAGSYVAVTLIIVLLLEALVVGFGLYVFTNSTVTGYWALQGAQNAAQIYALQAGLLAGETALDPETTFEPGRAASLVQEQPGDAAQGGWNWFVWMVPYVAPGGPQPQMPAYALLVGPDERVLASSYPDRFPPGTPAATAMQTVIELLPTQPGAAPEGAASDGAAPAAAAPNPAAQADVDLLRAALNGESQGAVRETPRMTYAAAAYTVWSRERKPLGAIYIRIPAGGPPDTNLLPELAAILIPSGIAWLCLMLPIGLVFGFLTTRGLIRRIERLAQATERFRQGDSAIRVPVGRPDEIGQLEGQFNAMAGQLVESFEQRRLLAEQSARREERARIVQEMESAHYIQQSLLPEQAPAPPGWQIETFYQPAREVGGDLYDFLALPDGRIGIVIGDATGKGMPSALIMATTVAMLRAAARGAVSPGQALALVNNLLVERIPGGMFATCFLAVLDPAGGRLCYANAGHNLPYLRRDGQVLELRAAGMPLGLMPGEDYAEGEVTLGAGECVLFYTDGLVEAHDAQREMFGNPRLQQRIQEHSAGDGLIQRLNADLQAFTGPDWEQEDDVTLVLLRRET